MAGSGKVDGQEAVPGEVNVAKEKGPSQAKRLCECDRSVTTCQSRPVARGLAQTLVVRWRSPDQLPSLRPSTVRRANATDGPPAGRFHLSFRDVQDLLAKRGIIVSNEAVRQWCTKFGPTYAARLAIA